MNQSLDSTLLVALAVKLQKLFEREDRFLSFPSGLGFSYDYLSFMEAPDKTPLSAQEQLNYRGDFARLMNQIPQDRDVFIQDASRLLWDEFKQTLVSCVFPESGLTPAEEQQLQAATDYLTDARVNEDGLTVPVYSPQVVRYYQYKMQYEEAERTYLDEQTTVENSTGPEGAALKQRWAASRQQELANLQQSTLQAWIDLGYKRQVEQYQAMKNTLEIKKYLHTYSQNCLSELAISEIPDLNGRGIGFYTTFFSPADAFDPELPWTSLTLTKSEIAALVQTAPAELSGLVGTPVEQLNLESISLEYNDVVLIRPWFKQEFFRSRCWKLPDNSLVSDGQIPGQGTIPAYISSMVVTRNIQIRRPAGGPPPATAPVSIPVTAPGVTRIPLSRLQAEPRGLDPRLQPQVLSRPLTVAPTRSGAGHLPPLAAVTEPPQPLSRTAFVKPSVNPGPTLRALDRDSEPVIRPKPPLQLSQRQAFYATTTYEGLAVIHLRPLPPVPPPPATPGVTETLELAGVMVMALVCKRLPKSPDPDPSLSW